MVYGSNPSIKNQVSQILKALQSGSILKVSGEDGTLADCMTGSAEIHDWVISFNSKEGVFIGELTWGNIEHGASYGQKASYRWNQVEFKNQLSVSLKASKKEVQERRSFNWSLRS